MGVHSKRVPAFVLPDRCLQARGLNPTVEISHKEQDEVGHDDSGNDNNRTTAVFVS